MELYSFFRSAASFRVRIVMNLKGIAYETLPVHLFRNGGEHRQPAYLKINPQGLVPTLLHDGLVLTQSTAICEYLEETHPAPPLLPESAAARGRVRSIMAAVACDIHPLASVRVMKYLSDELDLGEQKKLAWGRHWVTAGLEAVEALLSRSLDTGLYCHGDSPTLADAFLAPQVATAQTFKISLDLFPTLSRINARCMADAAFAASLPQNQPDSEG